jgi:hypothetical protein
MLLHIEAQKGKRHFERPAEPTGHGNSKSKVSISSPSPEAVSSAQFASTDNCSDRASNQPKQQPN